MGFDGFQNPPVGAAGVITRPVFKSDNYVPGVSGWAIFKNGNAEFNALGGSFQINANGVFFYVPDAGVGNLFAAFATNAGVDEYGNSYKSGLFLNLHQAWMTGNNSHTIAINPTGQVGPELFFIPAGVIDFVTMIGDLANNRLIVENTGLSSAKYEVNMPFVVTGGYQGVNTAQGGMPPFTTTGSFVEYTSAAWTPLSLKCPASETIAINTLVYGYNSNTANSTLSVSPKLKQGSTVLMNPMQAQNGVNILPSAAGSTNNQQAFVQYIVGQDILGGRAGQTLIIVPCWRISSGSSSTANISYASMSSYPTPFVQLQSG